MRWYYKGGGLIEEVVRWSYKGGGLVMEVVL